MSVHHDQFQAIQSMLAAGHRSVHLERHSLLLIGGVGGFLSVVSEWVITDDRFPDVGQRAFALLAWLAFWLGGMALAEHWLTHRSRARRAETLPFAQAQVTRAWWMLLTVATLGTFAMSFYGGGAMVYALWTVMLGLGIYFFGLFSRPLIEWIGLATILLGVLGLATGLQYGATRWLAASCFAIGMPLAGWLDARHGELRLPGRLMALLFWLVMVITPPLLIVHFAETSPPSASPVSAHAAGTGEQVLRLEAGEAIPLKVDLDSPILSIPPSAGLDMTLSLPVEVALRDGKPDGRYRIGAGKWREIHDGVLRLQIDRIAPALAGQAPEVRLHAVFEDSDLKGNSP